MVHHCLNTLSWVESLIIAIRAAWHGTRIVLRQVSPEAIGIFDFIIELYQTCSGDWDQLISEGRIKQSECDAFLEYAATFLSNVGNYYVCIFFLRMLGLSHISL